MRKISLDATPETIRSTYFEDVINRNSSLFYFIKLLSSIEGCFSLALDSKWGAGKTFFVRQAQMILEANNSCISSNLIGDEKEGILSAFSKLSKDETFDIPLIIPIYYDAWENDKEDDPIASIAYNILQQIDTDYKVRAEQDYVTIATKVIDFFLGRNLTDVIEALHGDHPFSAIRNRTPIQETVKKFVDQTLIERGDRLVVFIDELDRCKPSFAVRLLERIKHYFVDDRITFVFSVNIEQLQYTVCRYYGERFNACGYLDRFFDLRISLPKVDTTKFQNHLGFSPSVNTFDIVCQDVISYFNFELREMSRYLHTCKIATHHILNRRNNDNLSFGLTFIIPVMIGLKLYNQEEYDSFIHGRNPNPLISILTMRVNQEYSLSFLLGRNETFEIEAMSSDKKLVTMEEKLKEVYADFFVHNFDITPARCIVGGLEIDKRIQGIVIRVADVLTSAIYTES